MTGSDWIFKLEPQRSISDFTGRFCARFVVRVLLALYYLGIIFIWFLSRTRNCFSSNVYLLVLVLEHISRLSASCSTVTAKSTYYRSQVSGVNLTLALY